MPTRKPTGGLPGRMPLAENRRLKSYVVTMTKEMSEFAMAMAKGNRSEGVRMALAHLQKDIERRSAQD